MIQIQSDTTTKVIQPQRIEGEWEKQRGTKQGKTCQRHTAAPSEWSIEEIFL